MDLMQDGREVLNKHKLYPRVYSPINHLWDENTLNVVRGFGYDYMMDKNCTGILPYERMGVTVVPEVRFPQGVGKTTAVCIHHWAILRVTYLF